MQMGISSSNKVFFSPLKGKLLAPPDTGPPLSVVNINTHFKLKKRKIRLRFSLFHNFVDKKLQHKNTCREYYNSIVENSFSLVSCCDICN